jgi:hypothetical protein
MEKINSKHYYCIIFIVKLLQYYLLNTCYFLAVLLRTECVVQLREGEERERLFCYSPLVDMYGTCASEILNGRRPPKTRLCFACDHTFI